MHFCYKGFIFLFFFFFQWGRGRKRKNELGDREVKGEKRTRKKRGSVNQFFSAENRRAKKSQTRFESYTFNLLHMLKEKQILHNRDLRFHLEKKSSFSLAKMQKMRMGAGAGETR